MLLCMLLPPSLSMWLREGMWKEGEEESWGGEGGGGGGAVPVGPNGRDGSVSSSPFSLSATCGRRRSPFPLKRPAFASMHTVPMLVLVASATVSQGKCDGRPTFHRPQTRMLSPQLQRRLHRAAKVGPSLYKDISQH